MAKKAVEDAREAQESKSQVCADWRDLPAVGAYAYSDDRRIEVSIDARPWLYSATRQDIQKMEAIDWGGDYAADEVYLAAEAAGCPEAKRLADYLATNPLMPNGDRVGFEVHMDREEVLEVFEWLQERPATQENAAEPSSTAPSASAAMPAPAGGPSGGIVLTRKMVSAIARAFAEPGRISYLQRIDLIAQAIGYQNQATLMSVLSEAEKRPAAPAVPAAVGDPATVIVAFGQGLSSRISDDEPLGDDYDGDISERSFATPAEAAAYIQGLEDMDGWMEFGFAAVKNVPRYSHNEEFFQERDRQPGLRFEEFHDAKVARMRLEDEEDDGPGL